MGVRCSSDQDFMLGLCGAVAGDIYLVLVFFYQSDRGFKSWPGAYRVRTWGQPIHNTLLREGPSPWHQSLVLTDPTYPYRTPTGITPV